MEAREENQIVVYIMTSAVTSKGEVVLAIKLEASAPAALTADRLVNGPGQASSPSLAGSTLYWVEFRPLDL